ncbi:Tre1 family protein [Schizosaccharomyces cryophilus OY26]|uniref:Tre1 family protein n=1 Tax=Schizosaccharomyces cryophilus (strain OY26 / ATCC MYA-4695 / CBS 11777 / NBRC 106824 / NRRL Y48691) TaxID=653667 RepID=S9X0P1_SCHCR|nr:Tre1 family protein [Schizosaccharomyces cryophilus OY26]EPY50537.1 Tre1 family protein [Schizosaccharomyces cryophilus OY26]
MSHEKHLYVPPPREPPSYEDVAANSEIIQIQNEPRTEEQRPLEPMEVLEPPGSLRFPGLRSKLEAIHEGWESACHSFHHKIASRFYRIPFYSIYLVLIATIIILASYYGYFDSSPPWKSVPHLDETFLINYIKNSRVSNIQSEATTFASLPHVSGTMGDSSLSQYLLDVLSYESLDAVDTKKFYAYLNYPKSLSIRLSNDDSFQPTLSESYKIPNYRDTWITSLSSYAYSAPGKLEAPLIYVNQGTTDDFQALEEKNIQFNSSVVLLRSSRMNASIAIENAERYGASAVLVFDDSYTGIEQNHKDEIYPAGPYPSDDLLYRGSAAKSYYYLGDPLTPGVPSHWDSNRIQPENAQVLPRITAIPITYRDAIDLMSRLKGHGEQILTDTWRLGLPSSLELWSGSTSESSLMLQIESEVDSKKKQPIVNILGQITGREPDQVLIIGAPRDSWCGGASESAVSTALLMDIISTFSDMVKNLSWRPRRTIVFASWDAKQYNTIGSTEWVEHWKEWLQVKAVAYLNIDVAVFGDVFTANTVPGLKDVVLKAFHLMNEDNNLGTPDIKLDTFNYVSDATPFLTYAGVPIVELGFERGADSSLPVPFLGTCKDTESWISMFGSFYWEKADRLAKIWSLLALFLSNDPVVPYDLENSVRYLGTMLEELQEILKEKSLSFDHVKQEYEELVATAKHFMSVISEWHSLMLHNSYFLTTKKHPELEGFNAKIARFENSFLDETGLPDHEWFKHLIYGPNRLGKGGVVFPSIMDAFWNDNLDQVQLEIDRLSKALDRAHKALKTA